MQHFFLYPWIISLYLINGKEVASFYTAFLTSCESSGCFFVGLYSGCLFWWPVCFCPYGSVVWFEVRDGHTWSLYFLNLEILLFRGFCVSTSFEISKAHTISHLALSISASWISCELHVHVSATAPVPRLPACGHVLHHNGDDLWSSVTVSPEWNALF